MHSDQSKLTDLLGPSSLTRSSATVADSLLIETTEATDAVLIINFTQVCITQLTLIYIFPTTFRLCYNNHGRSQIEWTDIFIMFTMMKIRVKNISGLLKPYIFFVGTIL